MTETLKVKPYNPVDSMQSDEEVVDYFISCYKEDNAGRLLVTALGYVIQALGAVRAARLMFLAGKKFGGDHDFYSLTSSPD